jgi:hypothetical protein
MGSDFPKERGIESFHEGLLLDIIRGKMAKDARLHIPAGIDMKVLPPRCNAALSETAIVPEVDEEHRFGGPKIGEPFPHPAPLFWSRHEGKIRFSSDGNVMEVPEKNTSLLHQEIDEDIARQDVTILGSLRRGDSKKDPSLLEPIHHLHDSIELTLASSSVGFFSEPFEADRRSDISKGYKLIDHFFIDQCGIGIDLEQHIFMLFEEVEKIFPQKGLPARDQDQVDAHFFTFFH